jgi:polyisoprenyl-teichoic acid--peptidoglycan teichoic acid transferase
MSGAHRLLFVMALVTFGAASLYTTTALLNRVYPVLFPGQNLAAVLPLGELAPKLGISAPSANSVFNRRINLLIIGIDQRPDGAALEPANTDTIMVASIDPVSQQMSLLSIPRDMWVDQTFPDGTQTQDRINASWAEGVLRGKSADAGSQQLETDLKDNFGIAIDYWVLLDFKGAEKLFDAVGGVDVNIPPELAVPEWFYSDDDVHGVFLSFAAGPQHVDGYHAVAFGRYRTTDSDLYRVKRQQLVLTAALSKVFSQGLLNDPFALWDAYSSLIKTDIPRGKMPGYGLLLENANANVRTYSLGDPVNGVGTVHGWTTPGGADVLLWDVPNVEYWLAQAFSKSVYVGTHVEVRNANDSSDDTGDIALGHYLEFRGLPSVDIGPDDPVRPDTRVEVFGADRQELGDDIATWLNLSPSSVEVLPRSDPASPDVVVDVGTSFVLPQS